MSFAIKMLKSLQRSGIQRNICDSRRIALFSSISEHALIGSGRSGTHVYKGVYNGIREAAIKLLPWNMVDRSNMEARAKHDDHPNVVRVHRLVYEQHHLKCILERCSFNLVDLIQDWERNVPQFNIPNTPSVKVEILRHIVQGVKFLHSQNITLLTLNPESILFVRRNSTFCTKISTLEIEHKDGSRIGWRAPENAPGSNLACSQTTDIFAMGCLFHFIVVGTHPFDQSPDLSLKEYDDMQDARHLVSSLLHVNMDNRFTIHQVENHPIFWTAKKRLLFIRDVSDLLYEETSPEILALGKDINKDINVVGQGQDWRHFVNTSLYKHMVKQGTYNDTVVALLRLFRNAVSHHFDLQSIGTKRWYPNAIHGMLNTPFPTLIVQVQEIICKHYASNKQSRNFYILEKYVL